MRPHPIIEEINAVSVKRRVVRERMVECADLKVHLAIHVRPCVERVPFVIVPKLDILSVPYEQWRLNTCINKKS